MRDQRSIYGLDTLADWQAAIQDSLPRLGLTAVNVWPQRVTAYVSDGRWVADCPVDNGGIGCTPGNPSGYDFGCGTMVRVVFPSGYRAAETALLARPPVNRHWFPQRGERVADLRAENALHGLPTRGQ